jgi:hypothetical protein
MTPEQITAAIKSDPRLSAPQQSTPQQAAPSFLSALKDRVTTQSPLNPANWGSMAKGAVNSLLNGGLFSDDNMAQAQHLIDASQKSGNIAPLITGRDQNTAGSVAGDMTGHAVNGLLMGAATAGIGKGMGLLGDALPSFEGAGKNFDTVMAAAKDAPVDVSKAGDIALRIQEKAGRGGVQPKVVRDFVARATSPTAKPLTYAELRDYASNASRLSADEAGRLTPSLKRDMGLFAGALNDANAEAATQSGVGPQYASAMKEYRRASQIKGITEGTKDFAKQHALKAAGGGLLGYELAKKTGLL